MRRHEQLSLDQAWIAHPHAKELEAISRLLDENPAMAEAVARDLVRDLKNPESGAPGMSGDQVPAGEKVVSLFETHTDIVVKDRRETQYGHKVTLAGGASGLILDVVVERGNPADSTRALPMLERQKQIYGRPPRQVSFDGGYASKQNLIEAKTLGVEDVCFAKKRGLKVPEMVRSSWVYRRLRDFRACDVPHLE